MHRPNWQLPPGVARGTWDYLASPHIAQQYETDLADHPLFQLDLQFLQQYLEPESSSGSLVVADLGCGTARIATQVLAGAAGPQAAAQCCFLNIDLSQHMLLQAAQRCAAFESQCCGLRANLTDLSMLAAGSVDLAVCLFSSLGMIQGRAHRLACLRGVHRILKPEGTFLLHVHNRWRSLLDPGGWRWLLQSRLWSWFGKGEFGDRSYPYRGLPAMYLHIYSRAELLRELSEVGFVTRELFPINVSSDALLPRRTAFVDWRAGGYFAVARA